MFIRSDFPQQRFINRTHQTRVAAFDRMADAIAFGFIEDGT
jgi:hypothetical protein